MQPTHDIVPHWSECHSWFRSYSQTWASAANIIANLFTLPNFNPNYPCCSVTLLLYHIASIEVFAHLLVALQEEMHLCGQVIRGGEPGGDKVC